MGLAGPKRKQKLGLDPQNSSWRDDKSKFGLKMLQKMGWAEGKGLGMNEDGQTDHVKVRLKENTLGVGADKRTVDNWLDNNSAFDALLKGLNQGGEENSEDTGTTTESSVSTPTPPSVTVGRLYHRQKFLRNKMVSNYDQKDLNDILGVKAETKTVVTEDVVVTETTLTPDPRLKVATTSVQEYFAQKMAQLGLKNDSSSSSRSEDEEDERGFTSSLGTMGLGASSETTTFNSTTTVSAGGLGFVKSVSKDISCTEELLQKSLAKRKRDETDGGADEGAEVMEGLEKPKKAKKSSKDKEEQKEKKAKKVKKEKKSKGETEDHKEKKGKKEKKDKKKEKKTDDAVTETVEGKNSEQENPESSLQDGDAKTLNKRKRKDKQKKVIEDENEGPSNMTVAGTAGALVESIIDTAMSKKKSRKGEGEITSSPTVQEEDKKEKKKRKRAMEEETVEVVKKKSKKEGEKKEKKSKKSKKKDE